MSRTPEEQLVHFLSDMYSVELQALAQLTTAPDMAGDPEVAADFRQHYTETEQQADLVRARLEANGGSPSTVKDAIMKLGGKSFLLFAGTMPETPGRLVTHSYSYEAMEWAGYELLYRFAEHAGDSETSDVAKAIRSEERTMMDRLERDFDAAERVVHAELPDDELQNHVRRHLAESHALENQLVKLLNRSEQISSGSTLQGVYDVQLQEARQHADFIEQRLELLGSDKSLVEDSALALGGLNWSVFFQAQSDTAAKLAGFVYAVDHLCIGGYELLKRTAQRAGNVDLVDLCDEIILAKRASAKQLAEAFETAVQVTLGELQSGS